MIFNLYLGQSIFFSLGGGNSNFFLFLLLFSALKAPVKQPPDSFLYLLLSFHYRFYLRCQFGLLFFFSS